MNPIIRNILGVIAGVVIGGAANMALINVSGSIIPLPEGVDVRNMESLKTGIHLFGPQHFFFPFLAHATNAFLGAFIAALIAATYRMQIALGIAVLTLIGGIAAVYMIPAPIWFNVLDLVLAYIPAGWLGGKAALAIRK